MIKLTDFTGSVSWLSMVTFLHKEMRNEDKRKVYGILDKHK